MVAGGVDHFIICVESVLSLHQWGHKIEEMQAEYMKEFSAIDLKFIEEDGLLSPVVVLRWRLHNMAVEPRLE